MAKKGRSHAAAGAGSIRKVEKFKNGKKYVYWEARVTLGTDSKGKQLQKTFSGKFQKEVRERMNAAIATVDKGTYFEPANYTVKQWFEIWLSEYMAAVKPLTVRQYRSMSENHIFPTLGSVKLAKLTGPQLQKFFNQLAVDGKMVKRKNPNTGKVETVKSGEPLSAKSIRNIYDIFSKAIHTAIQQDVINSNPLLKVTIPKVTKKEVQPLTEEQQKAFIKAIQEHKYRTIYTVILFTGLREGEALGLTWDCVDWKTNTLKVYQQLQRVPENWAEFRLVSLKNNKARYIRISPYIMDILKKQRTKQRTEKLAAGETWQGFQTLEEQDKTYIFTDEQGKSINPAPLYENFKKIVAQIGIPEARVHDLRHTFAVNSLQAGDDVKTVQDNLGHATAAFTLDVYGHVSERMKDESARRQQAYIESLGL